MRLACKRQEFPLSSMVEQWNLGSCWWFVVPSVGCFPCRKKKRRVDGSGKKTRQPESDELKSRAKKNSSREADCWTILCALVLVKCRVVLCICLRVLGSRGSLVEDAGRTSGGVF